MQTKNIDFTGEVLPRGYDLFAPAELVGAGVILPATSLIRDLDALVEGDVANVYVSSPGGDCFMGAEIVIAARNALARGAKLNVTVGGIAASMAANFVAAVRASGGNVVAHANSQLMFHSAFTAAEGGAQALEDRAQLVRNTNAAVQRDLAALGITDCRAWFAEGREKWVAANEARELGLVSDILNTDAKTQSDQPKFKSLLAAFKESKMNDTTINEVVASAAAPAAASEVTAPEAPVETPKSETEPEEEKKPEEETPAAPEEPVEEPKPEEEEEKKPDPEAEANARFAKLQASHDKMISSLKSERDAALSDLATAKAEATSLKADVEKLKADLAKMGDQLTSERAAHEAVVAKAMRPAQPKYSSNRSRIASGMKIV